MIKAIFVDGRQPNTRGAEALGLQDILLVHTGRSMDDLVKLTGVENA